MTELTKADCESITAQNISNMRSHAKYVEDLPSIEMLHYALHENGENASPHECGAPMCAIGHVLSNKNLVGDFKSLFSWNDVSIEAFGFGRWGEVITEGDYWCGDNLEILWESTFGGHIENNPLTVANGMRKAADMLEAAIGGSE